MTLTEVEASRIRELLDELEDPSSVRHQAVATVIEVAIEGGALPSPFFGGRTLHEEMVIPLCIRLGVAVRTSEIEEGRDPRIEPSGFKEELGLAFKHWEDAGVASLGSLPTEAIWYEQVLPSAVWFGYDATTA